MNIYLAGEGPRNVRYKVDLSPDTAHHVARFGLDHTHLEHLLVTHSHFDHLDPRFLDIRSSAISGTEEMTPLCVYGSEAVERTILTATSGPEACRLRLCRLEPFQRFSAGELDVLTLLPNHNPPTGPLNFVVHGEGATVLLAWDTGYWPEETWKAAEPLRFDAVFMECTVCGPDGKGLKPTHHTFDTFLEMIAWKEWACSRTARPSWRCT